MTSERRGGPEFYSAALVDVAAWILGSSPRMTNVRSAWHQSFQRPSPQKQNGPPFSGPFVFDIAPISWPEQEPVLAQEPVPVPVPVRAQVPERVLGQVPERAQVRLASSVLPARAPGPVCWPLAARRVPDVRRFCRKRNTRQSPG
ncbi:hypothetical protein [Mesorhizobium huakuii]|uniref:Uncharacterized protein n=1 Tax=Mesorhizobium huakuii TaxID=28104 RepID=A0A7G6SL48_9HYPH|nr:hypothetical protein [Mesorhizobium huakuii]QND55230.1 hypothetical protein HB778_13450 [Mesorhizobium huakuii]